MAYGTLHTQKFREEWWTAHGGLSPMRSFKQPRVHSKAYVPRCEKRRERLLEYANVHVAVYFDWLHDSSYLFGGSGFISRRLGRYIWRKWFHWHDRRPPFLAYEKFSKPIGLKDNEPRDIQNIREFHRSLCEAVSNGLNQQKLPKSKPLTRHEKAKPPQPEDLRTYVECGREMAHLFRAIVIIVDNQVLRYKDPEIYAALGLAPHTPPNSTRCADGRDWIISQSSVLLFKTGDDAHLSSPISFQSLYDSGKALPVDRPDCDKIEGEAVVRIKIDDALEFVFDLIQREREAIPALGAAADKEDKQHQDVCGRWIDGVLEHAGQVGIDVNGFTWEAIRRAKAAANGEAFDVNQVDPPWNQLELTSLPWTVTVHPEEP
ncbi:hypothetical protein F5Y16DRAFT_351484 [Xylariaceae sp. FL0255]|nr:hypothetical protein F5Y16DRAFT_351484 [Xylariaceae sp. FL0255]